jgi:hypothetical protein
VIRTIFNRFDRALESNNLDLRPSLDIRFTYFLRLEIKFNAKSRRPYPSSRVALSRGETINTRGRVDAYRSANALKRAREIRLT